MSKILQDEVILKNFFYWINERHAMYQRRAKGEPGPWTGNPVLRAYKFTNPFRENDRDTIWMRQNWTGPNEDRPWGEQIFNCALFRMFGNTGFMGQLGWQKNWDTAAVIKKAADWMAAGNKAFTGGYIITNMGLIAPKEQVVAELFMEPLWKQKDDLVVHVLSNKLQDMHKALKLFKGFGGFMAYETVTDLNYTPVLRGATDRFTWANAGPGAVRGLNRLMHRPLERSMPPHVSNVVMQEILSYAGHYLEEHVPFQHVDMRCIEHSLCEWDKYQRIINKQGKPRSAYDHTQAKPFVKGPID